MAGGIQNDNWFIRLANSIKESADDKKIDVSTSDIINIFEKANLKDENLKDGNIDSKEFASAVSDYYGSNAFNDELSKLEDFTEAFDGIGSLDGYEGLSYSDLSEINKSNYNNSDTAAARKSTSGKRTSFEAGILNAQKQRELTAENHSDAVKPVKISEDSTIEELRAGRAETAKDLTEARNKLQNAENDKTVKDAQAEADKAQTRFDEAVEKADDEAIKELKEQKAETEEAIDNQNKVIDGLKNDISSTESKISDLDGQISANESAEPTQDRFTITDENGETHFNSNAFSAAHSSWEAKQKALENEKEQAEAELADLNSQLINAEDALTSLKSEKDSIETEITEALKDGKNDVSELKEALDEAKEKLETAKSSADKKGEIAADVAQLEINLLDYDKAVTDKLNDAKTEGSISKDKTSETEKSKKSESKDKSDKSESKSSDKSKTTLSSGSVSTPSVGGQTSTPAADISSVPNYTGGTSTGAMPSSGGMPSTGSNSVSSSAPSQNTVELPFGLGGNTGTTTVINNPSNISSAEEQIAQRNAGSYGINVDGKIGASNQQSTGDCWALSGINSLSYSAAGRKIIDKAIDYKADRAIVHTCFGDYTIMYSELQNAKNTVNLDENGNSVGSRYATGDDDVVIIELAIEKLRTDIKNKVYDLHSDDFIENAAHDEYYRFSDSNTLDGGLSGELIYYLTGNQAKETTEYADRSAALDNFSQNHETTALMGGFKQGTVSDIYGNAVDLVEAHAYAIKSADDKTVTFTNPWDSGKDITLSRDTFLAYNADLMTTDLSSVVKDQPNYPGVPEGFADYLRSRAK